MWNKLLAFWNQEQSLTAFLWLLVIMIFGLAPASQLLTANFRVFIELSFALVLIAGVRAIVTKPKLVTIAILLILIALSLSLTEFLLGNSYHIHASSEVAGAVAIAMLLVLVIKQTLKEGPITAHRIKGAVATYLLFGMLWAKLYAVIYLSIPGSFSGFREGDPLPQMLYFSFVTLTTLGYGDILPIHEIARSLSNAEALIGQLFPVITIARLVSLEIEERKVR